MAHGETWLEEVEVLSAELLQIPGQSAAKLAPVRGLTANRLIDMGWTKTDSLSSLATPEQRVSGRK